MTDYFGTKLSSRRRHPILNPPLHVRTRKVPANLPNHFYTVGPRLPKREYFTALPRGRVSVDEHEQRVEMQRILEKLNAQIFLTDEEKAKLEANKKQQIQRDVDILVETLRQAAADKELRQEIDGLVRDMYNRNNEISKIEASTRQTAAAASSSRPAPAPAASTIVAPVLPDQRVPAVANAVNEVLTGSTPPQVESAVPSSTSVSTSTSATPSLNIPEPTNIADRGKTKLVVTPAVGSKLGQPIPDPPIHDKPRKQVMKLPIASSLGKMILATYDTLKERPKTAEQVREFLAQPQFRLTDTQLDAATAYYSQKWLPKTKGRGYPLVGGVPRLYTMLQKYGSVAPKPSPAEEVMQRQQNLDLLRDAFSAYKEHLYGVPPSRDTIHEAIPDSAEPFFPNMFTAPHLPKNSFTHSNLVAHPFYHF